VNMLMVVREGLDVHHHGFLPIKNMIGQYSTRIGNKYFYKTKKFELFTISKRQLKIPVSIVIVFIFDMRLI
jgi:hypothetical protein